MRQRDPKTGYFLPDSAQKIEKEPDLVPALLFKIHNTMLSQNGLSIFDVALGIVLGNALFGLVFVFIMWAIMHTDKMSLSVWL